MTFLNIKILVTLLQSLDQMRIFQKTESVYWFYCACQNKIRIAESSETLGLSWASPFKRGLTRHLRALPDSPKSKMLSFTFVSHYVKEKKYFASFDRFLTFLLNAVSKRRIKDWSGTILVSGEPFCRM